MKIYTGTGKKYQRRNIMKMFEDYNIDCEDDDYEDYDDEIYED